MGWGNIAWWIVIALVLSPIWGALLYAIYEGSIRPARIPKSQIEMLAAEMRRRNPYDSAEEAFTEEQNAWYRSDMFEQGKWRRVRKFVARGKQSPF